jgi:hypothetical protein
VPNLAVVTVNTPAQIERERCAKLCEAKAAEMEALYAHHLAEGNQEAADRCAARARTAAALAVEIRALD